MGSRRNPPPPLPPGTRILELGERPFKSIEELTPDQRDAIRRIQEIYFRAILTSPKFLEGLVENGLEDIALLIKNREATRSEQYRHYKKRA